jgi:hypothetical protein
VLLQRVGGNRPPLQGSQLHLSRPRTPDKLSTTIGTDAGHVISACRAKRTFVDADVGFPIRGDLSAALLAHFLHLQRHCYFQLIAMIPEESILTGRLHELGPR